MNILEVENLTKRYGDFTAVAGIDFAVKKGDIFGFLGPNGAGKTTTINMLTGLAKITVGSVFLADIDWFVVLASVFFIAVTSTFLGLLIAVSVSEVFEAQTFSNFFRFPMIFLCGLFIPVQKLPMILQPLSYLIPLTYGADILKTAINGEGHLLLGFSFFMLVMFSLVFFMISTKNIKEKWIY